MERREINSLHDLKVERDFVKQEIQLKFSETHNEWDRMIFNLKETLIVAAVSKTMALFSKSKKNKKGG